MRQLLRVQRTPNADETHQPGSNSDGGESNANSSGETETGIITLSPTTGEAREVGTASVSDLENISEYGEPGEIGEPTFNPFAARHDNSEKYTAQSSTNRESRISSLPAQIAPFEIPTKQFQLSSGFPYHRQLFHFRVSPDEWSRFTDDVTRVCTLSTLARWAVWGTGVTVGVTSSAALTVFGIPPGYYAGKAVYTKAVKRKVRQGLKEEGELEAIMKFWNETVFMKKGCKVRLELPSYKKDKENIDDSASDNASAEGTKKSRQTKEEKESSKKKKKAEKFFKLIVEPLMEENMSGPLIVSPELDRLNEATMREINDHRSNRDTISTIPPYYPREPPAYASRTFAQELEANSPATAVESGAIEIREMPETTKTMND